MIRPRIDMKLLKDPSPKPVVRNHPFHGMLDQKGGFLRSNLPNRVGMVAADEAGIPHVGLRRILLPGEDSPLGIDHDDMVAGIDVGRIVGLVLSAKQYSRARGDPTDGLTGRINYIPSSPNLGGFCTKAFHGRADIREDSQACQGYLSSPESESALNF